MKVEFKFDDALPHQAKAIASTVAIFNGIPKRHVGLYANSASVVRQAVCNLSSFALARFTFSRMSFALAVQTKGFGEALCC